MTFNLIKGEELKDDTCKWDSMRACFLRTFAPIVSAHPYCARESDATSCHAMHRARALTTKMSK